VSAAPARHLAKTRNSEDAIRTVLTVYTPPGQPTRDRTKPGTKPKHDFYNETVGVKQVVTGPEDAADLRAVEAFAAVEARIDAGKILAMAPAITARAIDLIYLQDVPKQKAADTLNLDRFDLYRRLTSFAAECRTVA
jgi:hypothetical protein